MRTTIDPKLNLAATPTRQSRNTQSESSPRASFDDALKSVKPKQKHAEETRISETKKVAEPKKKPQPKTRSADEAPAADEAKDTTETAEPTKCKPQVTEASSEEVDTPDEPGDNPVAGKKVDESDEMQTNVSELSPLLAQQTQQLETPTETTEAEAAGEVAAATEVVSKSAQQTPTSSTQTPASTEAEASGPEASSLDKSAATPLQSDADAENTESESDAKESAKNAETKTSELSDMTSVNAEKATAGGGKVPAPADAPAPPAQPAVPSTSHVTAKIPEPQIQPHHVPQDLRFADDNHPHIVTAIRGELLPDGGKMTLKLDPPELGALQVQVHLHDGAMTATFQTSNDDATRMLSHSLASLKNALESQGINVEKLQVQQAPRDQQAGTNQDPREQQQNQWDNPSARQEQQRREMLQRMWRKLAGSDDPLDMVA